MRMEALLHMDKVCPAIHWRDNDRRVHRQCEHTLLAYGSNFGRQNIDEKLALKHPRAWREFRDEEHFSPCTLYKKLFLRSVPSSSSFQKTGVIAGRWLCLVSCDTILDNIILIYLCQGLRTTTNLIKFKEYRHITKAVLKIIRIANLWRKKSC